MKISFSYHENLLADAFTPAFSGDFWRAYLDDCKLGGKRELAVYSSDQAAPTL